MFSEQLLSQRGALITGAGQPLAAAFARRFAEAGARLALGYVQADAKAAAQLAQACGAEMIFEFDPGDPESIRASVRQVVGKLGTVDLLVNALLSRVDLSLQEVSCEQWVKFQSLQLDTTIYFCREVLRAMMRKHRGRIINVIDVLRGGPNTAAARGIAAMTRALASEVAPLNIYVNGLAVASLPEEVPELGQMGRSLLAKEASPLGRLGQADEIAEAALFLASDAARLTSGQCLSVNGGLYP